VKPPCCSLWLSHLSTFLIISYFPPSSLTTPDSREDLCRPADCQFLVIVSIPFIIYALHDKKSREPLLTWSTLRRTTLQKVTLAASEGTCHPT
jgi:hypothetical protein